MTDWAKLRWAMAVTAVVLLVVGYYLIDPVGVWWAPKCPFHLLTGLDCPGCGNQRAVHALLHGNLREAVAANPFFVAAIPYLAALIFGEVGRSRLALFFRRWTQHRTVIYVYLGLICVWWVVRNLI